MKYYEKVNNRIIFVNIPPQYKSQISQFEAFTLASKAGVNLERMREVLLGGFAQSRILDLHGQRIIDRNFKPGFKIKLHSKDMKLALQAGKEYDVALKGTEQVAATMRAAIENGNGELDHSGIVLQIEK